MPRLIGRKYIFGNWVCNGVEAYGKANGIEVKTVLFDPGQLDGNAIISQVVAALPQAVVLGLPRGMMFPILTAAEGQGLNNSLKWGLPTSAYNEEMPKAVGKNWWGKIYVHMELQPIDTDGADTKNWQAILKKYGDKSDQIDSFSQAGYLAAKVATNALLGIKGNIDRQSVFAAFKAAKAVQSDMLCRPWYYGPGDRHQPNHSGRIAMLQQGGFKTLTECAQSKDADLADVLALEAKGGLLN
ncbi:MAG: ABC transporter substrate-binding protein [Candidatus Symbiobacter sp.]|nr:ABC transporter substrate-binding protein [Candidatus Symbiobacter sp.]